MIKSITELFRVLSARGVESAQLTTIAEDNSPVSIRLRPEIRHFLRHQSDSLDLPMQRVIAMILEGVALASSNGVHERSLLPVQIIRDTFSAHGMNGIDVRSFFPDITLDIWGDDVLLQKQISNMLIDKISELFFVRKGWLKGDDKYLYDAVRWYKMVPNIVHKAFTKYDNKRFLRFIFIRPAGMNMDTETTKSSASIAQVGLVAEYEVSAEDGTRAVTYELYEHMDWNYWRSREEYKMAIAFCNISRMRVPFSGYELPKDSFDRLIYGNNLIVSELARRTQPAWYPEDLVPDDPDSWWKDYDEWKHIKETMEDCYRENGLAYLLS